MVILGGLGNFPGAIVGGLILGVVRLWVCGSSRNGACHRLHLADHGDLDPALRPLRQQKLTGVLLLRFHLLVYGSVRRMFQPLRPWQWLRHDRSGRAGRFCRCFRAIPTCSRVDPVDDLRDIRISVESGNKALRASDVRSPCLLRHRRSCSALISLHSGLSPWLTVDRRLDRDRRRPVHRSADPAHQIDAA